MSIGCNLGTVGPELRPDLLRRVLGDPGEELKLKGSSHVGTASGTRHCLTKSRYEGRVASWRDSLTAMARRRRYELTDEQFERIEDALPEVDGRGRPYEDHRKVVNGIFWVLRSGAPWRDLPERYGSWKTVYDRFRRWAEDGTLQSIVEKLRGELDAEGRIDWEQFSVDSTTIRASRSAAGGPTDDKKGTGPAEKTTE